MTETISLAQARRIALAAQGFGGAKAATPEASAPGIRQLNGVVERLGVLQIDSVNVWERSHYMPAFSRLGGYDKAALDRLSYGSSPRRNDARYIEYWAHEATFLPRERWSLFRWRMQAYRERSAREHGDFYASHRATIEWLMAEIAAKGPLPASAIEHDANTRTGPWWGWSDVKRILEALFRWGDLVAGPRTGFERNYALPHQVLAAEVIEHEVSRQDAHRELVRLAAISHGLGTVKDLADYYRLGTAETKQAIAELTDAGELEPVEVQGWSRSGRALPTWIHRDAKRPRRIDAATILSPFDPVVWERARAERLFDFHYRIEIYTPAPKRVFGYYSLPILLGDTIVGRVDLKNDRQSGVLRVQSAWSEPDAPADTAEHLAVILRRAADWQGLGDILVAERGTLAPALAAELAR